MNTTWEAIHYDGDESGNITLPVGPPFDGKPVLIKTRTGVIEAWWHKVEHYETLDGPESDGFYWVCYDDEFKLDLDDALLWMPIPELPIILEETNDMPRVYNIRNHYLINALYCGRGAIAGNPFRIGVDGTRDNVCNQYEAWAPKQPWWNDFLKRAKGRDLLCYCKPLRCHCDFILKEANKP